MPLNAPTGDSFKRFALDASLTLREAGVINFDPSPAPKRLFRLVIVVTLLLLAAVQYALMFGAGGHAQAIQLQAAVSQQRLENVRLQARNAQLAAEVIDLRHGEDAIEERARGELGLIRADETFYQVVDLESDGPVVP